MNFKNFFDSDEKLSTEDIVIHVRNWSLDRIQKINPDSLNAKAIYCEFEEWIDSENEELEIVSIDRES
jgi:hypothetical protein